MTENQRESFRADPGPEVEAQLVWRLRSAPCTVLDLSAGGAKVTSTLAMPKGTDCTLRLQIGEALRSATKFDDVQLPMTVLDSSSEDGLVTYRLKNQVGPGAFQYEAATKLVLEAQRRARAAAAGIEDASPMATDEERRASLRTQRTPRFGKGSLRPGSGRRDPRERD